MENYSRKNKISTTKEEKTPTRHHIKKGLSAFQKTLATIGSILGIITATITIMTFMNNNKSGNKPKSSQTTQTTIIKEIQKETTVEKSKANDTNTTSRGQTETSSASSDTKLVPVIIVTTRIQQYHQVPAIKKNGSVTTTIKPMSRSCSSFRFFLD